MEITDNLRWWILQHLRFCYRRKSVVECRYKDSCNRLEWLAVEEFIASRLEFHIYLRIQKLQIILAENKLEISNRRRQSVDLKSKNLNSAGRRQSSQKVLDFIGVKNKTAIKNNNNNNNKTNDNNNSKDNIDGYDDDDDNNSTNTAADDDETKNATMEYHWLNKLYDSVKQLRCDIDAKQETIIREENKWLASDRKVCFLFDYLILLYVCMYMYICVYVYVSI